MTTITLNLKKTVEQNASDYFEKAKKQKKKVEGAKKAMSEQEKKLSILIKEAPKLEEAKKIEVRKKQWYEKFRWFYTSQGLLCIGGRDATTNEIIIKKHAEKNDLVFHTDMAGSPFIVMKIPKENIKATKESLQEAADFVCVHSKAWKLGMATTPSFYVKPEQVTKEANTGEYLTKGSFVIRGKTNYITPTMNYAIGIHDGVIMGGPVNAVKEYSKEHVEIIQSNDKTSDTAKLIQKIIGGTIDEVISALPQGCKIKK